jgi:hypothetical protein
MDVISTTDGHALLSSMDMAIGGLAGLRDEVKVAHWALDMVRLEIPTVEAYDGPDAADYRTSLQRRLERLQAKLDEKQARLDEAEHLEAIRRSQEARQAALTAKQIAYCVRTLSRVEGWLDGLDLTKPADDDWHRRLLMRSEVAGVRDMLLNVGTHSVSISNK